MEINAINSNRRGDIPDSPQNFKLSFAISAVEENAETANVEAANVKTVNVEAANAETAFFPRFFPFAVRVAEGNAERPDGERIRRDALYARLEALWKLATHSGPGRHSS